MRLNKLNSIWNLHFKLFTFFLVLFINPTRFCSIAFKTSKYTPYLFYLPIDKKLTKYQTRGRHLDKILSLLTRKKKFPIPYLLNSYLNKSQLNKNGTVFCTSHLPLTKVGIRALIENGIQIDYALVGSKTKNNLFSIWGSSIKLKTIVKSPYVLLKAKKILEEKKSIILMVDNPITGIYSPNILKIVQYTNSNLIFFNTYFTENGDVRVTIEDAPFPFCKNDFEIKQNLEYLEKINNRIIFKHSK